MKRRFLIVAAVVVVVGLAAPARALLMGPLPVIDAQGETTWLKTLAQEIAQGESLKSIESSAISSITPTVYGWPLGSHLPLQGQTIASIASSQLSTAIAKIGANTGQAPATTPATTLAQQQLTEMSADTADIDAAKAASDNAEGDLSAQQVQHRFDAIGLEQQQKALALADLQQVQSERDDATLAAYLTSPSVISAGGSSVPTADEVGLTP